MRGNQKIERQKTMNDTDTQYWLLNTGITDSLTYQIFEDNAGGLHMLICRETPNDAHLIGACLSIMPDDIKACIANLEDWTAWEGLVDVKDYRAELAQIKNQCALVEETHVASLGFVRATYWPRMGEAAKQAFKYRAGEVFGGRHDAPAYAEPILKDFISGHASVRWSKPCKVPGFAGPVSCVWFSGKALYSYKTKIAVIDRRAHALVISGKRYSKTACRIQNGVESLARRWNFDVYYSAPEVNLDKVLV